MNPPTYKSISHLAGLALVLVWATGVAAQTTQESVSPGQQILAVKQEYEAAQAEFSKRYQAAQTDAEREKLRNESLPDTKKFAPRLWDLAQKHPKEPAAFDALVWLATTGYQSEEAGKALSMLARDHAANANLSAVCNFAPYISSSAAGEFLRAVFERNPKREIQAQACRSLYTYGLIAEPAKAETYLDLLVEKFADIKSSRGTETLADFAKSEKALNETFGIGKLAPDIESEDIHGEKFKLSDYRGKVVVIDFWGDW
ncbi:MAG: redoxin domain-containing protein [Verrucomicrobia bacterium]|nr:redoxin domain-containing protein [Verrucomicrobiota bacterium]